MKPPRHQRWLRTITDARPYAASHGRFFWGGAIGALVVVLSRIALPWTLKAALKPFVVKAGNSSGSLPAWMPTSIDPLWVYATSFLLLLAVMGFADYQERLSFARFSIASVRDLRSKAAQCIRRQISTGAPSGVRQGDAIARLIGDTARIKGGLKGFLVHVATNGMMAIGVSVVLIGIDPALGLVFSLGVVVTAALTWRGAAAIHGRAAKYRAKEGALAETIRSSHSEDAGEDTFSSDNSESAAHEARITLLQGRTTWAAHVVFGTTVLFCLWIGVQGTRSGRVDANNLVVFVLYALMMRAPLVQLARQGVRTGKIFACLERVLEITKFDEIATSSSLNALAPLKSKVQLRHVRVRLGKGASRRSCISIGSVEINAGQRIALVGPQGSGKTLLLQMLAGVQRASRGEVRWDDRTVALEGEAHLLAGQTHLLSALPTWTRRTMRAALGLSSDVSDQVGIDLLAALGAKRLIRRCASGLDTRFSSEELSLGERKQVALAKALLAVPGPSLVLMDDPTAGLSKRAARKMISAAVAFAGTRTLIMSFSRPVKIEKFDRVLELRDGRIVVDADPESWGHCTEMDGRRMVSTAPAETADPSLQDWEERNPISS